MSRKRAGTTLVELMVAMFVAMLILAATGWMFINARSNAARPQASFHLQQTSTSLVRWLQRDLSETSLQSICSFSNTTYSGSGDTPVLSLISARTLGVGGIPPEQLVMGTCGAVLWQKYVYYTLRPDPARPGSGLVIRTEGRLDKSGTSWPIGDSPVRGADGVTPHFIPLPSLYTPTQAVIEPGRQRTVAQHVLLPSGGTAPPGLDVRIQQMMRLYPQGGFNVYYLDQTQIPRPCNATAHQLGVPVYVDLVFLTATTTSTGRTSAQRYQLQIVPGN